MKEHQKEYRKNICDEQKRKIKDYQKQYRENNPLTEDKKQKMKEYQKNIEEIKKILKQQNKNENNFITS